MDSAEHSAILIDVMAEIHAPFLTQNRRRIRDAFRVHIAVVIGAHVATCRARSTRPLSCARSRTLSTASQGQQEARRERPFNVAGQAETPAAPFTPCFLS